MFQCLSYPQNFILLKSVEYIKSYIYAENSGFRFSRLRRHLKRNFIWNKIDPKAQFLVVKIKELTSNCF